MTGSVGVAILDIDGTLVDTNYHHTIAWSRAFAQFGIVLPLWRIHRHIGMGGDHVVPESAARRWNARMVTTSAPRSAISTRS